MIRRHIGQCLGRQYYCVNSNRRHGRITVAAAITMAAGKKISLMQRSTMQDAISAPQVGGIVRFTGFILKGIVIIELLGAAIMAPVFIGDYGFGEGLWMAVFHSISASVMPVLTL